MDSAAILALSDAQWGLIVTACTALIAVVAQLTQANLTHRYEREVRTLELKHERDKNLRKLNRDRKEELYIDLISRLLEWRAVMERAADIPALREASVAATADPLEPRLKARVTAFSPASVHNALHAWNTSQDRWRTIVRNALNGDLDWAQVQSGRASAIAANEGLLNALSTDLDDSEASLI